MSNLLQSTHQDEKLYHQYGVDILKDAVSLPGVSLQFLLQGTHKNSKHQTSPPLTMRPTTWRKMRSPAVQVWCSRDIKKPESRALDPINMTTRPFVKQLWNSMQMSYTSGQCPINCPVDPEKSDTTTNLSVSNHLSINCLQKHGLVSQRYTSEFHHNFAKEFQRCLPYSTIERWTKTTTFKTCWTTHR